MNYTLESTKVQFVGIVSKINCDSIDFKANSSPKETGNWDPDWVKLVSHWATAAILLVLSLQSIYLPQFFSPVIYR